MKSEIFILLLWWNKVLCPYTMLIMLRWKKFNYMIEIDIKRKFFRKIIGFPDGCSFEGSGVQMHPDALLAETMYCSTICPQGLTFEYGRGCSLPCSTYLSVSDRLICDDQWRHSERHADEKPGRYGCSPVGGDGCLESRPRLAGGRDATVGVTHGHLEERVGHQVEGDGQRVDGRVIVESGQIGTHSLLYKREECKVVAC